jgi:four helix bundle protein
MNQEQMRNRTKEFAKQIINLCRQLPENREGQLIGNQIFRSGTSVGSNYRAVCRARSKADFIAKIGLVLEETDETLYWLELMDETKIMKNGAIKEIKREANELIQTHKMILHCEPLSRSETGREQWGHPFR